MIAIIDYGAGNLKSVENASLFLGKKVKVTDSVNTIKKAKKIVLPGVGAFDDTMRELSKRGIAEAIKESQKSGKLYLGICLGLQVLFEGSDEGRVSGLGVIKGRVRRFKEEDGIKVPHIGWNTVHFTSCMGRLTEGIKDEAYFYFDHSYYIFPEDAKIVAGTTEYGMNFVSMIKRENIYGMQFHPERSQANGLKMLENFIKL